MKSKKVRMAVFSGTGNTLEMALVLAEGLRENGREAQLCPMERNPDFSLPSDCALGLATTVAFFSTYPSAWRFIDALPPGEGREAFLLATMGGLGGGMQGPIRDALECKGYKPLGSLLVKMPSNYGNKKQIEAEKRILSRKAAVEVKQFAKDLTNGAANWSNGYPLLSNFFASRAHGRKPWNLFNRMYPIAVDRDVCTGCGLCVKLCPEQNIAMHDGRAFINDKCQACQRCVAFCPCVAIRVPGKAYAQYRGTSLATMEDLLKM